LYQENRKQLPVAILCSLYKTILGRCPSCLGWDLLVRQRRESYHRPLWTAMFGRRRPVVIPESCQVPAHSKKAQTLHLHPAQSVSSLRANGRLQLRLRAIGSSSTRVGPVKCAFECDSADITQKGLQINMQTRRPANCVLPFIFFSSHERECTIQISTFNVRDRYASSSFVELHSRPSIVSSISGPPRWLLPFRPTYAIALEVYHRAVNGISVGSEIVERQGRIVGKLGKERACRENTRVLHAVDGPLRFCDLAVLRHRPRYSRAVLTLGRSRVMLQEMLRFPALPTNVSGQALSARDWFKSTRLPHLQDYLSKTHDSGSAALLF
jgi:hypothetical protein